MTSLFKHKDQEHLILNLDYEGAQLLELQLGFQGVNVIGFAQKRWSGDDAGTLWPRKEPPFTESEKVKRTLQSLLSSNKFKRKKIDILLPDCIAKTTILESESLPAKRDELLKWLYFKGQKRPSYAFEETRIGFQVLPGGKDKSKIRVLAVFTPRELVEGLEKALCDLGLEPGHIGLATFNLYNLFEKTLSQEDAAFVAVFKDFFSLLFLSAGIPVFFRSKPFNALNGRLFWGLKTSLLYYQTQNVHYQPRKILVWGVSKENDILAGIEGIFNLKPELLKNPLSLSPRPDLSITSEDISRFYPVLGMII